MRYPHTLEFGTTAPPYILNKRHFAGQTLTMPREDIQEIGAQGFPPFQCLPSDLFKAAVTHAEDEPGSGHKGLGRRKSVRWRKPVSWNTDPIRRHRIRQLESSTKSIKRQMNRLGREKEELNRAFVEFTSACQAGALCVCGPKIFN